MRICIHDWKLYPVTLLQGSALWTRGRNPIFTRIWQNDRMCRDDIFSTGTLTLGQGSSST